MTSSRCDRLLRSNSTAATGRYRTSAAGLGLLDIQRVGSCGRHERAFTTAQLVDRQDFEPRVMTALRWKEIDLLPYFSLRETRYGSSLDTRAR